jgi:galactokinase
VKRRVVVDAFRALFGNEPVGVACAPGRVNLIGEHTDYNDGFVLPMAIDRDICAAFRPREDRKVVVHSLDFDETAEFDLDAIERADHTWIEYVKGVAWVLTEAGLPVHGWEGVVAGDVPRGAGLSSSAALELVTMRVFAAISDSAWDPTSAAVMGRRVENEWIGVNSGIMDQMVVASAIADHALLIDCRSLRTEPVPLPPNIAVVILDTATRRGLVESAYNERRRQCETAATMLGVTALRDVDSATLQANASRLPELTLRRARHIVTENERTVQAVAAMRAGDVARLGELMNASHASLSTDFEVTNQALETIVHLAHAHPACFGARMTGAGFGGCAVAIVDPRHVAGFIDIVSQRFTIETGFTPEAYLCRAAAGAHIEPLNESMHA